MKLYYVTFPDREAQQELAQFVVDQQLAACVVALDADSLYVWEGEQQEDDEVVALFKTSESRADDFVAALEDRHPYDVPCIIELDAASTKAYDSWVHEATDGVVDRSTGDETVQIRFDVGPIFAVDRDLTVVEAADRLLQEGASDRLAGVLREIIGLYEEYGPDAEVEPVRLNGDTAPVYAALAEFDDGPVHIALR